MGAGASSAAPEDVEILTSFLGSLREHGKLNEVTDAAVKAHLEAKIGVGDDENTEDGLPSARRVMLLVILKAAAERYVEISRLPNTIELESREQAMKVARALFSSGSPLKNRTSPIRQSDKDNQMPLSPNANQLPIKLATTPTSAGKSAEVVKEEVAARPTADPGAAFPFPQSDGNADLDLTTIEGRATARRRARSKGQTGDSGHDTSGSGGCCSVASHAPARISVGQNGGKLVLAGIASGFEDAAIGGGTHFVTEIALYENGEAELGNHDVSIEQKFVIAKSAK